MKKHYEELAIKIIRFVSEDVITASGDELCREVVCINKICRELILPCDGLCVNLNPCIDKECLVQPCLDKCSM